MKTFRFAFLSLILLLAGALPAWSPAAGPLAAAPLALVDSGPHMVKDVQPPTAYYPPERLVAFQDRLWYLADDGTHGLEWWFSDGSEAGTQRLPLDAGDPQDGTFSMVMGGFLYYTGLDAGGDGELWRTDGTPQGTALVKNLTASGSSRLYFLGVYNGWLFFTAGNYGGDVSRLWKTNGSSAGTLLVHENDGWSGFIHLIAFKDFLLFSTSDDYNGPVALYRMNRDGTNVSLVEQFAYGGDGKMAALENVVLINAANDYGTLLSRTDGTPAGTTMLSGGSNDSIHQMVAFRGWIYFTGYLNSPPDNALQYTQGGQIFSLLQYNGSRTDARVQEIAPAPNKLFIIADIPNPNARDPLVPSLLWVADAGAQYATPLFGSRAYSWANSMFVFDNRLFFSAKDYSASLTGMELWMSDGTDEGTRLVADLCPGMESSAPYAFTRVGDLLFFLADDCAHGTELWVYDLHRDRYFLPLVGR